MCEDYTKEKWVELYASAITELKHALMAGRILEARNEIMSRLELLRESLNSHPRERQAITDALNNLRVLEREESKYKAEQQRQAVQTALEKLETINPMIQKRPSNNEESGSY